MTGHFAWVGPWNERSAIARFGQFVVEELAARGHAVTVFRSETGASAALPPLSAPGEVRGLPPHPAHFPSMQFDGVAVNVGDHYGFHGATVDLIQHLPCLGIFHDGFIANLASEYAGQSGRPPDFIHELVNATYGEGSLPSGTAFWTDMGDVAVHRPMAEWLARHCAGAIVHSGTWLERISTACPGTTTIIPLAYPDLGVPPPRPIGKRLVIATVGNANANKLPDVVLRAIGTDPVLRERCEYRVLGPIEPAGREWLASVAQSVGLPPPHLSGWIDDAALSAALAEVDVVACLRNPVLEGGSASLITAMYSARPTLVSGHGVYAEVPADTVLSCTPGAELEAIARHLHALLADPGGAAERGRRARAYALETSSARRYVDRLLPALEAATRWAPVISTAIKLGRILGEFGLSPDDPAADRLAALLRPVLTRSRGQT